MRIAAVIPAYNEAESIEKVVSEIHAVAASSGIAITPVVINDCSTDRTGDIISKLNCISIHLPINAGIGTAVQTGFIYAYDNGYDFAVQVDGDGQHPAIYIPVMLDAIREKDLDVVIGSRYIDKKGFQSSAARRAGIKYFKWLNRFLTGLEINDSTSGFRMLNRRALKIAAEYYPDEYPEPEAIILFSRKKLKVGECSVQMRDRMGGVSSINAFSSVYYMLKVTLAIIFTFVRSA